jgi:multicomponent Na+:H+ antiporter subunit A
MSMISVGVGIVLYLLRPWLGRVLRRGSQLLTAGPAAWYEWTIRGINTGAWSFTHVVQSGYLRYYVFTILVATILLVGYALVGRAGLTEPQNWQDVEFYELGLFVVIVLATLMTAVTRSYLTAIAALGVVGYGVALVFVTFGAPDLAMTQFLIETLTLILFLLVFARRRQPGDLSRRPVRIRDTLLALGVGSLMAALVLVATTTQYNPTISRYFVERSLPDAHGRNVVNVILVDFRALDTLGEITVLAAAGVGVFGLLRLRLGRQPEPPSEKKEGFAGELAESEWTPRDGT